MSGSQSRQRAKPAPASTGRAISVSLSETAAHEAVNVARTRGYGTEDFAAVRKPLEEMAGVSVTDD